MPQTQNLKAEAETALVRAIEDALATRPARAQRQLALFLAVLRWLPLIRYGSRLDGLSSQRQEDALQWFQDAPLPLLRKGFWGVKTLIFLAYYGRPTVGEEIAYRPSKEGNKLLGVR